uniref:Secreted protein n=1 Tax=Ascaris lumbricoides TaxID=6252 RepID=A0A0M3I305_ASCLU
MSFEFYLKLTIGCLVFNLLVVSLFYKLPLCTWEMLFIFAEYPDDMLDWLLADLGPFADLNDAVPAIPHNTPHIVHSHGDVPVQQMTAHVEQVAD